MHVVLLISFTHKSYCDLSLHFFKLKINYRYRNVQTKCAQFHRMKHISRCVLNRDSIHLEQIHSAQTLGVMCCQNNDPSFLSARLALSWLSLAGLALWSSDKYYFVSLLIWLGWTCLYVCNRFIRNEYNFNWRYKTAVIKRTM